MTTTTTKTVKTKRQQQHDQKIGQEDPVTKLQSTKQLSTDIITACKPYATAGAVIMSVESCFCYLVL
jgi:hypothetical protein